MRKAAILFGVLVLLLSSFACGSGEGGNIGCSIGIEIYTIVLRVEHGDEDHYHYEYYAVPLTRETSRGRDYYTVADLSVAERLNYAPHMDVKAWMDYSFDCARKAQGEDAKISLEAIVCVRRLMSVKRLIHNPAQVHIYKPEAQAEKSIYTESYS